VTTGGDDGGSGVGGAGRATGGGAVVVVAGGCRPSDNGGAPAHAASSIAAIALHAHTRRAAPNGMGEDEVEVTEREPFRTLARTLYVVATPLGNLRDVTLRALDILRSVDVVAAEDTRTTAVLLARHGIVARLMSLHEHNEARRAAQIVGLLREDRSVALVSDAGTPAVSDPGARLVAAVREAGFDVVPIPGPNAAIAAVSAAGIAAERFAFLGFLPTAAKARRELLAAFGSLPIALVVYEAPHRIAATLAELRAVLGGERTLVVARELTKKFETIARMRLDEASAWLGADPNRERGEFVLVIDQPIAARPADNVIAPDVGRWLQALVTELPPARAARVAAAATGLPREILYARARAAKASDDE
jgi:16S rRNA (cytidine1402-2'-O)-methyltransferase